MKKKFLIGLLAAGFMLENTLTVLAAPVSMPDGTIFDAEYYAQAYPDVASEIGTDPNALYNHYVTYGKKEGRLPTASAQTNFPINSLVFDAIYYAQAYPDVAASVGTDPNALYKHYLMYGRGEGRYPVNPTINETNQTVSAPKTATVLSNPVRNNNPYSGKTLTVPGTILSVDGLSYPNVSSLALGNGTVLQYDGVAHVNGGYVTATITGHNLTVRYDLLTSTNGTDFQRLPAETKYLFFIRNAVTGDIAGIFRNTADNGLFTFPANNGAQVFDINASNNIWIPDQKNGILPNGTLANGSYYITVSTSEPNVLTASNVFTINR